MNDSKYKKCWVCDTEKEHSLFYIKNGKPITTCKSCRALINIKNYYQKNEHKRKDVFDLENEIWEDVEGWEGRYKISNLGRLKRCAYVKKHESGKRIKMTDKIVTTNYDRKGYIKVTLCEKDKRFTTSIHRLIARAFIPNPENKPHVNHINGKRDDNRIENLEWATAKENIVHSYLVLKRKHNCTGMLNKGGKKIGVYDKDGNLLKEYPSQMQAQRETGINAVNIGQVCRGESKSAKGLIFKFILSENKKD